MAFEIAHGRAFLLLCAGCCLPSLFLRVRNEATDPLSTHTEVVRSLNSLRPVQAGFGGTRANLPRKQRQTAIIGSRFAGSDSHARQERERPTKIPRPTWYRRFRCKGASASHVKQTVSNSCSCTFQGCSGQASSTNDAPETESQLLVCTMKL